MKPSQSLPDNVEFGEVTSTSSPLTNVIYIDGCPYRMTKVVRFMDKGVGIRQGDEVAYVAEPDGSLSFLMNVIYMTEGDKAKHGFKSTANVKEQIRDAEADANRVREEYIKQRYGNEGLLVYTIGCTINLKNYENIRVEVTAPSWDMAHIEILRSLGTLATNDEATHEAVRSYIDRVFG